MQARPHSTRPAPTDTLVKRRRFLTLALSGAAAMTTGCGTILHRERVGRPHSRDIDWRIVAMDGLGLALFFVPGVIAFVVDFSTGAIYLPPEGRHVASSQTSDQGATVTTAAAPQANDLEASPQGLAFAAFVEDMTAPSASPPTAETPAPQSVDPASTKVKQTPSNDTPAPPNPTSPPTTPKVDFQSHHLPPEQLDAEQLRRFVQSRVNQWSDDAWQQTRVSPLADLQTYPEQVSQHRRQSGFGFTLPDFFRRKA